jgi:iron complex outermembrane receptor protein
MRYEILKSESTFNPKVSMRYQMSDSLVLRGSYSTSFREASLVQLNSDLVALEQLQDYNTDGTTRGSVAFIRAAKASNKTLTPEESDNINIGAVWKPNSQTSLTVDYWNIEYTNVITMENTQAKLIADPDGPDVVRLNGTLVGITASYFNASEINASGMDVQAEYKFDTSLGQASVAYDMAHIMEYEIPVAGVMKDVVGSFNHDNFARSMPETKSVISASLRNGDHKISAYYRMISDYENGRTIPASAVAAGFSNTIDEFNTLDLKYSYSFSVNNNDGTLSVGVNNATDEVAPGAYDLSNFSYDSRQHDPRGKIVNVGLKISF